MPGKPRTFNHRASSDFWRCFEGLPVRVQVLARRNYALLREDPRHPSLQFKKVGNAWSVRVGLHHRALAVERPGGYVWFWIGTHADYDRLLP